jgi:hypothetical protein
MLPWALIPEMLFSMKAVLMPLLAFLLRGLRLVGYSLHTFLKTGGFKLLNFLQ